jgi:hypothetical protein
LRGGGYGVKHQFQQYFSYMVAETGENYQLAASHSQTSRIMFASSVPFRGEVLQNNKMVNNHGGPHIMTDWLILTYLSALYNNF